MRLHDAQDINGLSALANQQVARAEHHRGGLHLFALGVYKPPRQSLSGFAYVLSKKRQALRHFPDATNETCSLVTINWSEPCADLDEVAAAHRKFADETDNWRDGLARRDRRFGGVSMFVVLEVQHNGSMWLPHWHVVMHHPGIDREEIGDLARARWPGKRRVQAQRFDTTKSVGSNIADCVGYAFKFKHTDWSVSASARLFLWIRRRAALRSMCVAMRPKGTKKAVRRTVLVSRPVVDSRDEPMPVVFGDEFTLERGHPGNWWSSRGTESSNGSAAGHPQHYLIGGDAFT